MHVIVPGHPRPPGDRGKPEEMRSPQVWGCGSLGHPGGSGSWVGSQILGKTHSGFHVSPTLPPTVVCQREGVARRACQGRPPAPDGQSRGQLHSARKVLCREEKERVKTGDGGRWGCLEGGSQETLPGGPASKTPLL